MCSAAVSAKRPPGEGRLIQLVYYGYVAGSAIARWLPERFTYGTARLLGRWAAKWSKKRSQVASNLARITGHAADSSEVEELVVKAYQSYARYWLETFRLVRENAEFFRTRVRSPGKEHIEAALAQGKGAIVVVGHLGNWDAAGAWAAASGWNLVTVAEVLKPRRMFDFFLAHREHLGMTIYPAERGVTSKLAHAARDGAVLAILGDRDLKGTGPLVDFFGAPAHLPAGAAWIALETGVPLMVAGVYGIVLEDGKRGWEAVISPPLELPARRDPASVAEATQTIAKELEKAIARHPEQWHMFQPVWEEAAVESRPAEPESQTESRRPRPTAEPPEPH